ncbi:oxidoreductase [Leptospira ellinghausenii]|uniref:Oxidoreductase n=1 Tax=Leptospira ellinghausenii TaxID=1917822 RepID=A0A2P2DI64_9LEPT|nr:hypothetical protein [Leptospira ellinghausenii]GBF44325.1 oxidoreductase [Leptospira ellinghausenii]
MLFQDALKEIVEYANSKGVTILNKEQWTIFQIQRNGILIELLKIPRRENTNTKIHKSFLSQWKSKIDDCEKVFIEFAQTQKP